MKSQAFIYCLWCPVDQKIRYIGKTTQPDRRLSLHILAAKRSKQNFKLLKWLRQLLSANKLPRFRILFKVPENDDWQVHERRIIDIAIRKNRPLTNQLRGGNNFEFISPDDLARTKLARAKGMQNTETKMRKSQSMKSAWANKEIRRKIVAKQKAAANTPERKASLSAAFLHRTPQGEANRIAAVKKYWANPLNRKKAAKWAAERNKKFGHL